MHTNENPFPPLAPPEFPQMLTLLTAEEMQKYYEKERINMIPDPYNPIFKEVPEHLREAIMKAHERYYKERQGGREFYGTLYDIQNKEPPIYNIEVRPDEIMIKGSLTISEMMAFLDYFSTKGFDLVKGVDFEELQLTKYQEPEKDKDVIPEAG